MAEVSASNKTIARTVAEAFGGRATVRRFWDDNHQSFVDILRCDDRPRPRVASFATIGLSDFPIARQGEALDVRAELVGACGTSFESFDNALATAAFCVINTKWDLYPGAIFPDALAMYDASPTMRHFLFVPPFLWEENLKTLRLPDKTVAWLLAVPISEREYTYAVDHGSEELESLFVERQIDIFDLHRDPATS